MKYTLQIFLLILYINASAQLAMEVYVFDIDIKDGIQISNPVNISLNTGKYDNQPSFRDKNELYFVSSRNNQTDVILYNTKKNEPQWLTETRGSEYSPTPIPGENAFSYILLKTDGEQLLWKYPLKGGEPEILIPDLKVGYHTWLDEEQLVVFVLEGEGNNLYLHNTLTRSLIPIAKNIGRSLKIIPETNNLAFVDKSEDQWLIKIYDPLSEEITELTETPDGSEDMLWIGNQLVMGKGSKLLKWSKENDKWELIADLKDHNLGGVTRMSINNSQNKLAIVVNE